MAHPGQGLDQNLVAAKTTAITDHVCAAPGAAAIVVGMSDDLNTRQEAFVRGVVRGKSQRRAYVDAGYAARGDSADACASRMLSSARVKRRVKQIAQPVVRKAQLDLEALIIRIEAAIADARRADAHGPVMAGHSLLLRIAELVAEQDTVNEPQFGGAQTAAEIRDMLVIQILDLGIDAARELAEKVLARIADQAVLVS